MTYCQKAKDIKITQEAISKNLSNENLSKTIQDWVKKENKVKGYLIGLSPLCNVTEFSEIQKDCLNCNEGIPKKCRLSDILRNLAAGESIRQLLEEDKCSLRPQEAMLLVEEVYPPYTAIKEYATRNCKGQWHNFQFNS